MAQAILMERVERLIYLIRGHKVMLDSDLAELYGVSTKRLNEQVRRNSARFPSDFMFQLTSQEADSLRSQIATLKQGGRRMSQTVGISVKRINRLNGEGATKAFCDVTVAESFLVKGLRVVEGKKGLFVSMPQEMGKDGTWYDTVIPLTKEARQQIVEMVLAAYQSNEASLAQTRKR